MGCLRLGWAFITSLFITAVFMFLGVVSGALISSLVVSHGATAPNLSSQGVYIGGGVGSLLGLLVMRARMKRAANVNWLKSHGTRITATVVDIEKKTGYRQVQFGPNAQYSTQPYTYYVIVAQWMDPGTHQQHTFRRDLNFYPRKFSKGSRVSVLIDPHDPGRSNLVEV